MSNEINKTYKKFLGELLKTKCLYENEVETSDSALRKQEILLTMIDNVTDCDTDCALSYVAFINEFVSIVKDKRTKSKISDIDFFSFLLKVFEKRNNKAHGVFFLNKTVKERNRINLASILKTQNKMNTNEIKNYLYIMYVESCNIIYPNIVDSSEEVPKVTYENYNEILEDFLKVENTDSDIKDELKSLISDILPESGVSASINDFLNDKQFSGLIDGVIKTVCPEDKMDELREELRKTDRDEIKKTVGEMTEQLSKINIEDLMSTFNNPNIMEQVSKTMEGLNIDGINNEDIKKAMDSMNNTDILKSLFKKDN